MTERNDTAPDSIEAYEAAFDRAAEAALPVVFKPMGSPNSLPPLVDMKIREAAAMTGQWDTLREIAYAVDKS